MKNILKLTTISLLLVGADAFAYAKKADDATGTTTTETRTYHHKDHIIHKHRNTFTALNSQHTLSTFTDTVKQDPELVNTLKAGDYTVFAPINKALKADKTLGIKVINTKDYIVPGKLSVSDLRTKANKKESLVTLAGTDLSVEHKDNHIYVNGVKVTRVNEIHTGKGNVYLIDTTIVK